MMLRCFAAFLIAVTCAPAQQYRLAALAQKFGELYSQARYADAQQVANELLHRLEQRHGESNLDVAASLNNLASLAYAQGQLEAAEPLYRRALEICEKLAGAQAPQTATALANLAGLYVEQGHPDRAEPLYRRILEIRADDPMVAELSNNLGFVYLAQQKYPEAERALTRAVELWQKQPDAHAPYLPIALDNLALLRARQGRAAESERLYRQALSLEEKVFGPDHPETATTLLALASLYREAGKPGEAAQTYQRAEQILESALGPGDPRTIAALRAVGSAGVYQLLVVETRERAGELREKIAHGESFADLAAKNSLDPTAVDRGFFKAKPSDLRPQLRRELDRLAEGQTSAVFELDGRWAIVRKVYEPPPDRRHIP